MDKVDLSWVPTCKEAVQEWAQMVRHSLRRQAYFKSWEYGYDFEGARPLVACDQRYDWGPGERKPSPCRRESTASTDGSIGKPVAIPNIPDISLCKEW